MGKTEKGLEGNHNSEYFLNPYTAPVSPEREGTRKGTLTGDTRTLITILRLRSLRLRLPQCASGDPCLSEPQARESWTFQGFRV